ncbi:MAG: UvrD-helicase domain-containing protein [Prevotella sp.]|nr:UvrD-helicase domain-containing protein [Prevotella sp.]
MTDEKKPALTALQQIPGDDRPLTVYKASAGSGKTFTLAVEYIKLLIKDPQNYRYILAVTFTNKATQEMKQRILSKLYGIAHGLKDDDDYFNAVRKDFPQLPETEIRSLAGKALSEMVHNYSYFRVETIDSFFQRILRNLARELDLTANLQVVLNDKEVERQAVDNIIEQIEKDDDPLLAWIMEFVQERMADDKNWNVIGAIKSFGENIFSDFYKSHQEQLKAIINDGDFFKTYKSKLQQLKRDADNRMKGFAQRYEVIAKENGLTDSNYFHGHSNVPGYFECLSNGNYLGDKKMPNSYVAKGLGPNPEGLLKKSDIGTPEGNVIVSQVAPLLKEAEEARQKAVVTAVSVDITLQHINELRLLGRIEKEVSRINNENNEYLLSNTQALLRSLIDEQDSPFIYEKIGGQLRFIMIDEFQDTSIVQWQNFEVLLNDCIAHDKGSMIVGDVKQSIYRWRDGDWHQLQSLREDTYPQVKVEPLKTNYRSDRNIIGFNNAFFTAAANHITDETVRNLTEQRAPESLIAEAEEIRTAYADVEQLVPDSKPAVGRVEVTLLPAKDYDEQMIAGVQQTIEHLLELHTPEDKIAVIVRRNKHIKLLASYFLHHPVTVNGQPVMLNMVSDEAFRLDASLAVNIIVKAMRLLIAPDDRLTEAFLVKAYRQIVSPKDSDAELFVGKETLTQELPQEMTTKRDWLLSLPLIDLAEQLYAIFRLNELAHQSAYVCAFFDEMANFVNRHVAGIEEFLEEWDTNLCAKSIHSDEINGIRLLTIHKSKGLEFDNVIIPYCDWTIEDMRDILWAEPKAQVFNALPLVPLNLYAKRLQNSIYKNDYLSEHTKNLIDNLNLLYVAFTRASRNLFIIGKNEAPQLPSLLLKTLLPQLQDCLKDKAEVELDDNQETKIFHFTFGVQSPSKKKKDNEVANIFEQKEEPVKIMIENTGKEVNFLESNASKDFMTPDDELDDLQRRQAYIETGNILHALFATIHNYNEIDQAVAQFEFDGVPFRYPMSRNQLKANIKAKLENKQIRDWFSPHWKVFNECSILYFDHDRGYAHEARPDRVIYDDQQMIVIDFKTGKEKPDHIDQVRGYMQMLRAMGFANVSGYLWYIHHDNIVKVE